MKIPINNLAPNGAYIDTDTNTLCFYPYGSGFEILSVDPYNEKIVIIFWSTTDNSPSPYSGQVVTLPISREAALTYLDVIKFDGALDSLFL